MPAAAVIPAPVTYTKVVAVKTLVVGFLLGFTMFVGTTCSTIKLRTLTFLQILHFCNSEFLPRGN